MKRIACLLTACAVFFLIPAGLVFSAEAKTVSVTCIGLYSETSDGYVSFREAGKSEWKVIKVGDVIPVTADIKINVERDWVEIRPTENTALVFELAGGTGEIIKKVSDVLKGKGRAVSFPNGTAAKPDAKFKDKLVVTEYLGRQIYVNKDGDSKDIKYGEVLDLKGKVKIIAINNTIMLLNASGQSTKVLGPLTFTVEQVLTNKNLYKFLNVQK